MNGKPQPERPASSSQYAGTTKNTICGLCNKNLNNLNRLQQDEHEENCKKQEKLF